MFPAARIGDPVTHDLVTPSGLIVTTPSKVFIEYMPAAHVAMCTVACTGVITGGIAHPPLPAPVPIVKGSSSVLINDTPAARWLPSGDTAGCGVFLGNPALLATRKVFIGD